MDFFFNAARSSLLLFLLGVTIWPSLGYAQDQLKKYPDKPIRLVVAFSAGGTTDVFARLVAQKLGASMGQQVIVDNRPGSNGNIGTDMVAKASADGYTLLLAADGTMVVNPGLYTRLPFNPDKDFISISRVALVPMVIVAHPSVKADSLSQLVALSKNSPSTLYFSSAGPGSIGHLTGEYLKTQTGMNMTHVPYKGGGQAVIDVVSGQVQILFTTLATAGPFINTGKLKAIAVTSAKRMVTVPNVPTVAESGVPGFNVVSWFGLVAPAGTPAPITGKLHAELMRVLGQPDVRAKMQELGAEPAGESPEEFSAAIRGDLARWGPVIKAAGITAD